VSTHHVLLFLFILFVTDILNSFYSEIFFVPYIWDVAIGALTASTFEWTRSRIQVFPLNHELGSDVSLEMNNDECEKHEHTPDVV
jgi:hypothetical protein